MTDTTLITTTTGGLVPADLLATSQYTDLAGLPVVASSGAYATMLRVVVPVCAGDVLDIVGDVRVTNNVGYTVGVGVALFWYDVDIPEAARPPWTAIQTPTGDNVDVPRHHLPLSISRVYTVPADWPAGHRMTVVLRADAMSTAWQAGDRLVVDPYGQLIVRRWSTPAVPPAS